MRRAIVILLLIVHAGLLAWQAYRYSPTIDEPAHLAAGISHWKFGRFDLYRVNPPLVRLVAALPMLVVEPKTDWSAFTEAPYARPEFSIGTAFANANGFDTFWHFTLARWACIPFSLIGGWYCYLWARDLYGGLSGLMALALWCFCPNILGNGTLITPDVGATSLGLAAGYHFWRWLRTPTWPNALIAGLALGLAELTKSTWIVLFVLWPVLWIVWRVCQGKQVSAGRNQESAGIGSDSEFRIQDSVNQPQTADAAVDSPPLKKGGPGGLAPSEETTHDSAHPIYDPRSAIHNPLLSLLQLTCALTLALYLLNIGYGFENSFQRLDKFEFISKSLGGPNAHEKPGNRFADSWIGALPVPVPANHLRGIDVQKYDFEKGKWSYLRGEQKMGGWWYYYLYAMGVKMPAGTLFLLALTCVLKAWGKALGRASPLNSSNNPQSTIHDPQSSIFYPRSSILDELTLLAPAILLITLVSSQTGFNRYLRYVVPAFPYLYIWISQLATAGIRRQGKGVGNKAIGNL